MNIQQLTNAIQKDLEQVNDLENKPIIEVMKTIMRIAEKHTENLSHFELGKFITYLPLEDKIWDQLMVLRVCTLEYAVREAMVISACDSVLKDYMERIKA